MRKSFKRFISLSMCMGLILSNSYSGGAIVDVYATDDGINASETDASDNTDVKGDETDSSSLSDVSDKFQDESNSKKGETDEDVSGAKGLRKSLGNSAPEGAKGGTDGETSALPNLYMNSDKLLNLTNGTIDASSPIIYYGDDISFKLDVPNLTLTSYYTIANDKPITSNGWMSQWGTGADNTTKWDIKPSSSISGYYVGFDCVSSTDEAYVDFDGNYGFRIAKGTYNTPTALEWNEKTAKWNVVTKTVSGGDAKEGSFKYDFKLYKEGNTTPIVEDTVDATSYDLSTNEAITKYGNYYFTVQAVPTADYTDLYNASAVATSSNRVITDVTAPSIKSYTGADGVLTGVASDAEAGVKYYKFTTTSSSSGITDWDSLDTAVVGTDKKLTYTLNGSDHGTFYFHVKDADGNASVFTNTIKVTHIQYQGYYDASNGYGNKDAYIVGDNIELLTPSRPGYTFGGWFDGATEVTASNITAGSERTLTAKWTRSGLDIATNPQDIEATYDGTNKTLTAAVDNNIVGTVNWTWYKVVDGGDDTSISTSTGKTTTLNLMNVSDSGKYYAKAVVTLDDGQVSSETLTTTTATVTINKKSVSIMPDDISLNYGDAAPSEYTYKATGVIVGDESEITGKMTSSYTQGSPVGTYNIVEDPSNKFEADNYSFVITTGTLKVGQKAVDDSVVVALANSSDASVVYKGSAYTPAVTVKDNNVDINSDNYEVAYSNNTNAGTATITVTFKGNYTGTKSINFEITKATPEATVLFEKDNTYVTSWEYGTKVTYPGGEGSEVVLKTNTTSDSNTRNYHFLDASGADITSGGIPKNAGTYKVYVEIPASNNCEAISTASSPVEFTIEKRELDIMVICGYTHVFDGEEHKFTYSGDTSNAIQLVNGTSFAVGEGLNDVKITGSISNVGTLAATKDSLELYPINNTDLENNYTINVIPDDNNDLDKIIITPQKLDTITGLKWGTDANEIGVAEWNGVARSDMVSSYTVSLYRKNAGADDTLVTTATVDSVSHDFGTDIRNDIATLNNGKENPEAYDYYFTVTVSAKENGNYATSDVASGKTTAVLHTALVYSDAQEGIANITMGANATGYIVMLQGETANVNVTLDAGYTNPYSWTDETAALIVNKPNATSTSITLDKDITKSYDKITFKSKAVDDSPLIETFTGETSTDGDKVYIGFTASDSKDLIKWMISASSTAPSATDAGWNDIAAADITSEGGRVKILYDTTKTEVTTQGVGNYYAYVMDSAGNITKSDPLGVYKINFSKGKEEATGTMASIFKVEDVAVTLPEVKYVYPGYGFVNWKTDSSTYSDKATYSANASDTLVAQWSDKLYSYTVEYYLQDTEGVYPNEKTKSSTFSSAYGATVGPTTSEILLKDEGFTLDTSKSETKDIDSDDVVIKLYYSRNTYTLKYILTNPDNTTTEKSYEVYYGATITEEPKTELPGYTFIGWTYSDVGTKPETMPAYDITATAHYKAGTGKYNINYYMQDVTDPEKYNLYSSEEIDSEQGTVIDASIGNVSDVEGFTCVARHSLYLGTSPESYLTVTQTELNSYKNEDNPTVSAVNGQTLNINYYFTRNVYTLTFILWNSEERTKEVHTRTWNLKYGAPIVEADYINDGSDQWETKAQAVGVDTTNYKVSNISSWSTGLKAPETMPAGHVTVSRQYIPNLRDKFKVEMYLQRQDGSYPTTPDDTVQYDGTLNEYATVGSGSNFTVNTDEFEYYIPYYQYAYSVDETKSDMKGLVVDTSTNDMLVLKVYLKRTEITATINYIYRDINGNSTTFATLTRTGLWSTLGNNANRFTFDPFLYFYATDSSAATEEMTSGLVSGVTINGESPINYNFNINTTDTATYKCSVSVYKVCNYSSHASTYYDVTRSDNYTFGTPKHYGDTSLDCYVNVYYTEIDDTKGFYFDFRMNKNVDSKYLKSGETQNVPITITKNFGHGEKTYKLRAANLCDLVDTSFTYGEDDAYYAANILKRSSSTGGAVKPEFEAVTINGRTYYITDNEDGDNYIYIPNTANTYYPGRYCSASYHQDTEQIDIPFVQEWLDEYKLRHSDENLENRDTKAAALYIYNRGNTVMNHYDSNGNVPNATVTVYFNYGNVYNLNVNLLQTSGQTLNAQFGYSKGSNITYKNIMDNIASKHFAERNGYEIKWYLDKNYENPLVLGDGESNTKVIFSNIQTHQYVFGRYEKKKLIHHLYTHYMTKNPNKSYLTIDDIVTGNSLNEGFTKETETRSVTYKDEEGHDVTVNVNTVTYKDSTGTIVLKDIEIPGIAYSELTLSGDDIESYRPNGFYYDEANTDNKTYAYCEHSPVKFHIYYARNKHTLKVDNKYDKDNVVTSYIKRYGYTVTVADPVKPGYEFLSWDVKKIVSIKNEQTGEFEDSYVDLDYAVTISAKDQDGNRTFEMPDDDIIITAQWKELAFDTVIKHFFQTDNQSYVTSILDSITPATGETVSVSGYGTGKKYAVGNSTIIEVSATYSEKPYTLYFTTENATVSEGTYTLDPGDLVMATNTITVFSNEVVKVNDQLVPTATNFNMYDFSFMNFIDTQDGTVTKMDGVTVGTGEGAVDQTKLNAKYGMELDYFYTRKADLVVKTAAFTTDAAGSETGLTLSGDGTYLYGKNVTVSASLDKGYTFKGWYNAADVLAGYDATLNKALSEYELDSTKLASATAISLSTDSSPYQFDVRVTENKAYVAVSIPDGVATPTVTISGKNTYTYGYSNSSDNKLTATVDFGEGVDASKYTVKSYQWYLLNTKTGNYEKITGATSGVYNFDTGKNAGEYTYKCEVVVEHINNGRTVTAESNSYKVTVNKKDLTVSVTGYSGYYDGEYHNVTATAGGLVKTDQAIIYYATEELTSANYLTIGKTLSGSDPFAGVKDVNADTNGNIIPTRVYVYVVSADTEHDNYNGVAGYADVALQPKTVTITTSLSGNKFTRLYDGTTAISGSVTQAGTDKYRIAHGDENGTYLRITGLTASDAGLSDKLFVDFTGTYNNQNVNKASKITLSDMKLVDNSGKQNFNYVIPKTLDIQGTINKVPVTIVWPTTEAEKTFTYNGDDQVVKPTGVSVAEPSNTQLKTEIDKFVITTIGAKTNVNSAGTKYTATAEISIESPYLMSNYKIENSTCDFTIVPRTIYVKPTDDEVTYDSAEHGLDTYKLLDSDQTTEYTVPTGFTEKNYTYDKKFKDAGEYTVTATGLKIYSGQIDESYNYTINYLSGTLTINQKSVTINGITANNKNYDGTTAATLDFTNASINTAVDGEKLVIDSTVTGAFTDPNQGTGKTVNITYGDTPIAAGNDSTKVTNYIFDSANSQKTATADINGCNIAINTVDVTGIYGEDLSTLFSFTYGEDYAGVTFVPDNEGRKVTGTPTYKVLPSGSTTPVDYSPSLDAGTYKIVVVTDGSAEKIVSGMQCANYTFVEGTRGTLTINPRPIAIEEVLDNITYGYTKIEKTYDGNTSVKTTIKNAGANSYYRFKGTGADASGVLTGDSVDIAYTSAAYNSKDVSTATSITVSGITLNNSNYILKTADGTADNSTLVLNNVGINKQELAVKVSDKTITYGTPTPAQTDYTVNITGFVNEEGKNELDTVPTVSCEYDSTIPEKRNVGDYTLTPTGGVDDNYSFKYTGGNGTLTVKKATLAVVAKDETFTYSEGPVPTWTGEIKTAGYTAGSKTYVGLQYNESATDVITGSASYSCPSAAAGVYTLPGTYDILAENGTLASNNYDFAFIEGKLTVNKKSITVSGITIQSKVYDGTTNVNSAKLVAPEANTTNYSGVDENDLSKAGIVMDASHMQYSSKDVGTRTVSLDYDNGTKLAYSLNDYLKARYIVDTANSQKVINNAVITRASLNIKADDIPVSEAYFYYGSPVPTYTATYTGLVNGETKAVLKGEISFACDYTADGGSSYSVAKTYTITPSGYTEEINSGNYEITFTTGTLTVTANQFNAPAVLWSDTEPGVITWTKPTDIGNESVKSYTLKLYRADTATGTYTEVNGSTVTYQASDLTGDLYTHNYHNLLDDAKGVYKVQVTATSSNEANAKSSHNDLATADKTYSTLVTVQFASDSISQAGQRKDSAEDQVIHTTINGAQTSYIMVAGDSGFPYTAELKGYKDVTGDNIIDCTGYDVKTVTSSDSQLSVTEGTKLYVEGAEYKGGTVYKDGTVSAGFDIATTDASVTIALSATPADGIASLSFKNSDATSWELTYGYDNAPTIVCDQDVVDLDKNLKLALTDYEFSYNWKVKRRINASDSTATNISTTINEVEFPSGMTINPSPYGYYVECTVVATRKDNGESKDIVTYKENYVQVKRAKFNPKVVLNGWVYGEKRNTPSLNAVHPEASDSNYGVTYYYSDKRDGTYTTDIPTNVGTYYVKVVINQTANYDKFEMPNSEATEFKITKNKLATPSGLLQPSPNAPYGGVSWNAVDGPKENAGTTGDSASYITPRYEVKLYEDPMGVAANEKCVNTAIIESGSPLKIDDWTSVMNEQGNYFFTIQALSNNTDNCDDSDLWTSGTINISRLVVHDRNDIYYDGNPITLSLQGTAPLDGATFKWYKDGTEISGATSSTYQLTDVNQSGKYTCVVTENGVSTEYSTIDTIVINRRPVKITTSSGDKIYDGTPLTMNDTTGNPKHYKIEFTGGDDKITQGTYTCSTALVTGDSEELTITGTQTVAGSSKNTFKVTIKSGSTVLANNLEFKTNRTENLANYAITSDLGTLEVTTRAITVTANNKTKVYGDDDPTFDYSTEGIVTGESLTGITLTRAEGQNVGDYEITATAAETSNPNYSITFKPGKLKITPKSLTITADPKSKIYGDADPAFTYTYNPTSLPYGDTVSGTLSRDTGEGTENVGTHTINQGTVTVTNSDNYDITYNPANLTIVKKKVQVIPTDASKKYGAADPNFEYTVKALSGSDTDSILNVTLNNIAITRQTGEDFGTYTMYSDFESGYDDTSNPNYEIAFGTGTFTIGKQMLTIKANAQSKVYGSDDPELTYTVEGLQGNDSVNQVLTGSLSRTAGENVGTYAIGQGTLAVANDDYEISFTGNNLTITKAPLTVKARNTQKTYGDTDPELKYEVTGLVGQDILRGVSVTRVAGETVGTYDMTASAADSENPNYDIIFMGGTFTINKKAITVKADAQSKIFGDADPQLTYKCEPATLPFNDTLTVQLRRVAGEDVGNYAINQDTITVTNSANYQISYTPANLTIEKKGIEVVPNDASKVYGEADPASLGYKVNALTGSNAGQEIANISLNNISVTRAAGEAAGTYTISSALEAGAGETANQNYTITYRTGIFTIERKKINVIAGSKSRRYDGTPLTDDTYVINDTSTGVEATLPFGDTVHSVTITGTITNVGTENNVPTGLVIHNGENDVTSNYDISYTNGTLEIISGNIIVVAASAEKTYDGTPLTVTTVTTKDSDNSSGTGLADGDVITATVTGSQTDAGSSASKVTVGSVTIMNGTTDVTGNYTITGYEDGTLTVTKRTLTLTAGGTEREYDGTDLKTTILTPDNLVGGHSVTDVTWDYEKKDSTDGNLTTIGTIINKASGAKIEDADGNDVTSNYEISYVNGESTIIKNDDVTIKTDSDQKTYDGKVLKVDGYELVGNLATGDKIDTFESGVEAKSAGTYTNKPSKVVVVNANGDDVTENYDFGYDYGTITVDKRKITFTSQGATKAYDGMALTNSEVEISGEGIAEGEDVTFDVTGSQTLVGSSANTFDYDIHLQNNKPITASAIRLYSNFSEGLLAVFGIMKDDVDGMEDNYDITIVEEQLVVTDDGAETTKKTHSGTSYKIGEEIPFDISVTNIYADAKNITITELEGVLFENGSNVITLTGVQPGETKTVKATHVVTEADITSGNGEYANTVNVKFDGVDTPYQATDKATIDKPQLSCKLDFAIVSTPPGGGDAYRVGDTIEYEITLTNDGNQTLTVTDIVDTFKRANGSVINLSEAALAKIRSLVGVTLKPGESASVKFDYQTVDADKNTSLSNTIDVTVESTDKKSSGDDSLTSRLSAEALSINVVDKDAETTPSKEGDGSKDVGKDANGGSTGDTPNKEAKVDPPKDKAKDNAKDSPLTADNYPLYGATLVLLLSAAGIIIVGRRKRKYTK